MRMDKLFQQFISGTPIKRKTWRGYWKYNPRTMQIDIHTKEFEVIPLTDTSDILFTVAGILADDWEVATNDNCDIPVEEGKFNA